MSTTRILICWSVFALLTACGRPGDNASVPQAEPAGSTSADIGTHEIHFSAQSTDQLPPEIARAYNILRSKNRAMLNLAVIRKSDSAPVTADIVVKTVNLTGQLKNVTMRQITEQDAIYYIGETAVANRETLVFDISVKPDGVDKVTNVRFKREFYTD